jgi:hypothetical protein
MRTLVVGVLAATLAGCSCYVSPQSGVEACTGADGRGFACFDRNVAASRLSQATEPEPSSVDPGTAPREKTELASRTARPTSARATDRTRHAGKPAKPIATAAAKAEPPAAAPPPDAIVPAADKAKIEVPVKLEKPAKPIATAVAKAEPTAAAPPPAAIDPVADKARIAVAVKLENPASAIFSDMSRSMRQNMRGQFVDTICGHVRGKKASGEDIGDRPFLYLVKDDEAYVADDSPTSGASTAYRNICN